MSQQHPMIGRILADDYQIVSFLGQGGMGSVFTAIQLSLNRKVAVKLLPIQNISPKLVQRFDREIATMAAISHPNIVTIHHRGKFGDPPNLYYIMEFMEGESLRSYLNKHGKLPISLALKLTRQVAEALAFAHEQGCIHRDIKPDNLLFNKNYRGLKVADFGIAKLTKSSQGTHSEGIVGTLVYAAPEQLNWFEDWDPSQTDLPEIDERADQYSLGMVLYEMLTGTLPYRAHNMITLMKALSEPPTPLSQVMDTENSPGLEWLVSTMTAKSIEQRFATDEELLAAIDSVELEVAASVSGRVFAVKSSDRFSFQRTSQAAVAPTVPSEEEKAFIQNLQTVDASHATSNEWLWHYGRLLKWAIAFFLILIAGIVVYKGAWWALSREEEQLDTAEIPVTSQSPTVSVSVEWNYDVLPPKDYPVPKLILVDAQKKQTGIQDHKQVPRGKYRISVKLPGYVCPENNKSIQVAHEELVLKINLIAKPRLVNPRIVNLVTGKIETPVIFKINDKELKPDSSVYKPGEHYFYVQFKNYQEIDEKIKIPPANSPFQLKYPLRPLKEILFTLDYFFIPLKDQMPSLEIFVDGEQISPHHYQYRFHQYRLHGFMQISSDAKKILVRFAYYYSEIETDEVYLLNDRNSIDVDRLLIHLASIDSSSHLEEQLQLIWSKDRDKLKKLSAVEQQQLYRFLASFINDSPQQDSPGWQIRWLLNSEEAQQAEEFFAIVKRGSVLSLEELQKQWRDFLRRYPDGIFKGRVTERLSYLNRVESYLTLFKESVKDCYVSLSERRAIENFQNKIAEEDIQKVRQQISEYVNQLDCGKNLQQMFSGN